MEMQPRIIVVGGSARGLEEGCLDSCEFLCSLDDGFVSRTDDIPNLTECRRSPAVYSFDVEILVAGGCSGPGTHLNSISSLNISENRRNKCNRTWNVGDVKLDEAASCTAYCQFKDSSVFLAGGYNGFECLSDVFLLRRQHENGHSSFSVAKLAPLSTRCKNGAALATGDDDAVKRVLIFGGWDEHRTLRSIFEYKIYDDRQECSIVGVMPTSLEGHTVTRVHGHPAFDAIICGGYDGLSVVGDLYTYKIDSGQTMRMADVSLEIARENHVASCLVNEGRLYFIVAGGWNGQVALKSCELFEILDERPFLKPERAHKLQLNEPRNRPGIIQL